MFICVIMMLSFVMTSCSLNSGDVDTVEGEEELSDTDRTPVTLTFWLPAESEIDAETVALVENAMNEYLKSNYTTAIDLEIYTEENYAKAVEDRIAKIEKKAEDDKIAEQKRREEEKSLRLEGKVPTQTTALPTDTTEVETFKNEWGVTEQRYPSVGEYQMDIFLITDYTEYLELIDRGALHELDTNLNSTSKVLKSYIYPTYLEAAKFNGTTYAIPNNHGVDDYKFLLLNKELVDELHYNPETLASAVVNDGTIAPLRDFLDAVIMYEDMSVVTPLLSWVEPAGMTYWSENGEWSAIASVLGSTNGFSSQGSIGSIFKNNVYKSNFKFMKTLEEGGYIAADPENCENFAVAVVDGSYSDIAAYEENYYVSVYEYPMATQESVFAGAFAVSEYTENLDRAMEIITALNTDPELRNILQYGVEDTHYRVVSEDENGLKTIEKISDDYPMNILYTGNTYMAYFDETMTGNEWEDAKQANLASGSSPFLYCPNLKNEENAANFAEVTSISAGLYERLMATKLEDVDTFFSEAHSELTASELAAQLIAADWEYSLTYMYSTFYAENFAVEEVPEEGATE